MKSTWRELGGGGGADVREYRFSAYVGKTRKKFGVLRRVKIIIRHRLTDFCHATFALFGGLFGGVLCCNGKGGGGGNDG